MNTRRQHFAAIVFAVISVLTHTSGCAGIKSETLTLMREEASQVRVVPSVGINRTAWCGLAYTEHAISIKRAREEFSGKIRGSRIEQYFPASIKDATFPVEEMSKQDHDLLILLADPRAQIETDPITRNNAMKLRHTTYRKIYPQEAPPSDPDAIKHVIENILVRMKRFHEYQKYQQTHENVTQ